MPGPRRVRKITVTAVSVSVFAAALWGVAVSGIWHRIPLAALTDDQVGAGTATIAAVILWSARWLATVISTGGIVFLIDAMLTQRAWYRRRLGTATGPLRFPSPRHAR